MSVPLGVTVLTRNHIYKVDSKGINLVKIISHMYVYIYIYDNEMYTSKDTLCTGQFDVYLDRLLVSERIIVLRWLMQNSSI